MEKALICESNDFDIDSQLPWSLLKRIPSGAPILFLGSHSSRYSLLALSFDEESSDGFLLEKVDDGSRAAASGLPFTTGQLALLSYDAYNMFCEQAREPCRFFRIKRSLVIDQTQNKAYLCEESSYRDCQYQLEWPLSPEPAESSYDDKPDIIPWTSPWEDARYLETVKQAIDEIKNGRYYQINLLRYWQSTRPLTRPHVLKRLERFAGPYAAWIDLPDLGLVSWSPERLLHAWAHKGGMLTQASPIKGTRAVHADPEKNAKEIADLLNSKKDFAELHMIVDLMRNDLLRICKPGSVKVLESGALHSFANVHHLIACIEGSLREDLTLGHLCRAICPGGSITGAPKREVMDAIGAWEERERGYFMGNIFYRDSSSKRLDASILIRTAVRQPSGLWEYAAGSGITVKSEPYAELEEVLAKARIVLENPW